MPTDVSLRCQCGQVRGIAREVAPTTGTHVVCYCDDCQCYAHFLGRPEMLDRYGGTDVFQMPPSRVQITQGVDQLRCVRLFPRGLFRWYTACCKTPVGNLLNVHVPFVGLIHAFMDHQHEQHEQHEQVLGPATGIQGRFAIGGPPPNVHPRGPLSLILRVMWNLAKWRVRGENKPSAFFDDKTGQPPVTPKVLTPAERGDLLAAVRAGKLPG